MKFSETFVPFSKAKERHIPEDSSVNACCCEKSSVNRLPVQCYLWFCLICCYSVFPNGVKRDLGREKKDTIRPFHCSINNKIKVKLSLYGPGGSLGVSGG